MRDSGLSGKKEKTSSGRYDLKSGPESGRERGLTGLNLTDLIPIE